MLQSNMADTHTVIKTEHVTKYFFYYNQWVTKNHTLGMAIARISFKLCDGSISGIIKPI